jgi:hypothetical protein
LKSLFIIFISILSVYNFIGKKKYFTTSFFLLTLLFNYLPILFLKNSLENFVSIDEYEFINNILIFWVVGFFLVSLSLKTSSNKLINNIDYQVYNSSTPSYLLFFLLIFISVNIISNNIYSSIKAYKYGYLFLYTNEPFLLIKNSTLFPFLIFFFIYIYSELRKKKSKISNNEKYLYNISIFLSIFSICTFLFYGGRSTFLYFLLIFFLVWNNKKKIKIFRLLLFLLILVFTISIIGLIREGGSMSDLNLFLRPFIELSQTCLVLINGPIIINNVPDRYFLFLLEVFPHTILNFFDLTLPETLALRYSKLYDSSWSDSGGGFGFTILAELYIIGKNYCIFFGSFLISSMCLLVDQLIKSVNSRKVAMGALVGFYLLMLPRGEFFDIYRATIYSVILLTLFKVKIKGSIKNFT